jgi:hypothetical protein
MFSCYNISILQVYNNRQRVNMIIEKILDNRISAVITTICHEFISDVSNRMSIQIVYFIMQK